MTNFSTVSSVFIPEGAVREIIADGVVLWSSDLMRYVSLGDSIAAGHTIDDNWDAHYGTRSQYGESGNASTVIVPNSYTDLIRGGLMAAHGEKRVSAVSFARSGDRVLDLIPKLDHEAVRNAIGKADLVTVCIGANDILGPALNSIEAYIRDGRPTLAALGTEISANLAVLADDANPNSFKALFDKLKGINPNAKYTFTTIYNPYKYLWVDYGQDGFFGPLLSVIPNMDIDVDKTIEGMFGIGDLGYYRPKSIFDWEWVSIELNIDLDDIIKDAILETPLFEMVFDRVNCVGDWAEEYINALNDVLKSKIAAAGPNFTIADVKAAFDRVPDRPIPAERHYNDLVNVEFTRGYDTAEMDWGALWRGSDPYSFWWDLAAKHLYWSNALPSTNPFDYVSFDSGAFVSDLVAQVVEKVIVPDIDPHPETYGHEVAALVFGDALGL